MDEPKDIDVIVSSISDSQTVEWGSSAPTAPSDPELVEMLQIIEKVGQAHQHASEHDDPDHGLPFRTWGHLRILECIGKGNYGEVFRAWDANLSREVALKLFHADAEGSVDFLTREELLEEARTLARLRQENIVRVHGADIHRGRVGFWMEYVVGEPLNEDLESRGGKSPEEVVSIGVKVARALASAHASGILHRDIKASNIVREAGGHIYLMDFGAGALLKGASEETSQRVGTPLYMAPEVLLEGKSTPQSDIYSLGVFLFHALTLRYPYEGETIADLVQAHRTGDVRTLDELRSGLPKPLREVVERCLHPKPERRYASATAVADALQEVLVPRRSSTPSLVNVVLATAIAILLLTQVPWVRLSSRLVGGERADIGSVAVLAFDDEGLPSEEVTYLSFGLGTHLTERLSDLTGVRVTPWANSKRYSPQDLPLREAAEVLNVDALVVGSLIARGSQISGSVSLIDGKSEAQLWTYAFEESRDQILEIEREISEGLGRVVAGGLSLAEREALAQPAARSVDAYELYLKGAIALQGETEEENDRAYELFRRALEIDAKLNAARIGMGAVHLNRYFFGWQGGYSNLERAEELFRSALEQDEADIFAVRGLALALYEKKEAMAGVRVALSHALDHPDDPESLVTVAHLFMIASLPGIASDLTDRVIELDPSSMSATWLRVCALSWEERYAEAIEAGETYFLRFGEDVEVHTWMGYSYLALGQPADAIIHLERARRMQGDNLYVHVYAAMAHGMAGDDVRAAEIASETVAEMEVRLVAYPDNTRLRLYAVLLHALLGNRGAIEAHSQHTVNSSDAALYKILSGHADACEAIASVPPWQGDYMDYLSPHLQEFLSIEDPVIKSCIGAKLEGRRGWEDEYYRAHAGELSALGLDVSS